MVTEINGLAFKNMVVNAAYAIDTEKQSINDLNVFPVPDGDTGTNMSLTIGTAANEMKKGDYESVSKVADIVASALLRGARGNSGVILSLLFRGIAKSLKGLETADAKAFAAALQGGVSAAYNAVMKPTEGTILTVSRLSADTAVATAENTNDIEEVLEATIERAKTALDDTINQNPVLKKAGVVDAGGKGYICILDGMLKALRGEMIDPPSEDDTAASSDRANFSDFSDEDITHTYCTEFIVSRENHKDPEVLRQYLAGIGDSIVMVVDDDIIKVHVHNDVPGNVLTEALSYGQLLTVKIENMREQHTAMMADDAPAEAPEDAAPEKKYGVVSVCAGDGLAETFKELGVDRIIVGGQTMNPSTEDILKQVRLTPAEIVYVLPNNKNIIMAAQQCEGMCDKKVIVIPTKTVMQGISAMMYFDPSAEEAELTEALSTSFDGVHTAAVTYAARDSEFDGQHIMAGQFLALLEGTPIANTSDFDLITAKIIESVRPFMPELITIFYGENVLKEDADEFASKFEEAFPGADVTVAYGGQPVYYYMISAE